MWQKTNTTKHALQNLLLATILGVTAGLGTASGQTQATLPPIRLDGTHLIIDGHVARYDKYGHLLPWTPIGNAIAREMEWYRKCPFKNGYPRFVSATFMNGAYQATSRTDMIPAMQDGMGIISYLKYYHWTKESDPTALQIARAMGNFLVKETLTPDTGRYPRFTRSTGRRGELPLRPNAGSQADGPYEIEPDKGGIAGYALMLLYDQTHDPQYLNQALQNARDLVRNMVPGDQTHSPWPFRVDYRTGAARGPVSSDMVYILRLFDQLIAHGYTEFKQPRARLWTWIKTIQIPNARRSGNLWVQFFEDYNNNQNRNSWAALNMARYLVEQRSALDPDWKQDSRSLINFAVRNFCTVRAGLVLCGEQDQDKDPWGGAFSTFGGVLAQYSAATGDPEYKGMAWQILSLGVYAIGRNGAPRASIFKTVSGGWQEDAHTDKIHNYISAMEAYPAWARIH
jgi:hypothetical protein